jgi:hypothetical protein
MLLAAAHWQRGRSMITNWKQKQRKKPDQMNMRGLNSQADTCWNKGILQKFPAEFSETHSSRVPA